MRGESGEDRKKGRKGCESGEWCSAHQENF